MSHSSPLFPLLRAEERLVGRSVADEANASSRIWTPTAHQPTPGEGGGLKMTRLRER